MAELPLPLMLAGVLMLGALSQWLAWRVRLPAILFLLLLGILLGPVTDVLDPDALMGQLLFPLVTLGVAVILFEGSLTLRFAEVRGVARIIRNLTTIGVLVTWGVLATAAHYLAGLSWSIALLFGAIGSVTGPTVVVPMLRSIRPTARIANVLRWEGIIVDPIGALLAVLVFEAVISGQEGDSALALLKLIGAGSMLGTLGALLLAEIIRRHWMPEYLINYFTLSLLLLVVSIANLIEHESGLVAATVMGMILANMRNVATDSILDFKEHLTVLLISMLFILLAARMDLALIQQMGWTSVLMLLVALLVARPLAVLVSSLGTTVNRKEALLLAWIAPRGIVAAAVSALFAIRLVEAGVPEAEVLIPLVLVLIIGTVIVVSATAGPLARMLGLSRQDAQGVLIVGANRVSLAIAEALHKQGIEVTVADDHWDGIQQARMLGLGTYFGDVLSEHADMHLDMTAMTRLFLVSRRPEYNTLVYTRYRPDFGANMIYALALKSTDEATEWRRKVKDLQVPSLFGGVTWTKLASKLSQEHEIRWSKLTEAFGLDDLRAENPGNLLFAINPSGRLSVFSGERNPQVGPGWRIAVLAPARKERAQAAARSEESDTKLPG